MVVWCSPPIYGDRAWRTWKGFPKNLQQPYLRHGHRAEEAIMPTLQGNDPRSWRSKTMHRYSKFSRNPKSFFIYFAFRLFRNGFTIQSPSQKFSINLTFKPMKSLLSYFAFANWYFPIHAQNIRFHFGMEPLHFKGKWISRKKSCQKESSGIGNVANPKLSKYTFLQKQIATGKSCSLIFPGGVTVILAYDWRKGRIFLPKWLKFSKACAGIVVKYRLPKSASLTDPKEVPLMDAQTLRFAGSAYTICFQAWNIDPSNKFGIMGILSRWTFALPRSARNIQPYSWPDMDAGRCHFLARTWFFSISLSSHYFC